MKFSLQKIEQYVPDELLEKAEQLLQQSPAMTLEEIEKNLWSNRVQDASGSYEVEIQLQGARLVAYSCDCKNYGPKSLCVHLTASLLQLRSQRQKAAEAKQQEREVATPPRRLTTNIILQKVSPEELSEFVRHYAKSSRQFALALKARFASSISEMDREEKYRQILLTAIKSVRRTSGGQRIPQSGLKVLLKVLEELQEQCNDTILRRDFQEAFALLYAIFEPMPEVFRALDGDKKTMLDCLTVNIQLVDQLLEAEPAPELAAEVWEFLRHSFEQRYLSLYQFDRQFLQLALDHTRDQTRAQRLLETVVEIRSLNEEQDLEEVDLIIAQLDLLNLLGEREQSEALIQKHLQNVAVLQKAIELAEQLEQEEKIRQLIQLGLPLENLESEIRDMWEDRLLQLALADEDRAEVVRLASALFLRTHQSNYWDYLRQGEAKEWPKLKKQLLEALEAQQFSVAQRDILAWVYASEQDFPGLLNFLQQTRSIDLLLQYDHYLLPEHSLVIYDLYRDLLLEYLNQHLGRQPSVKVKKVLQHLQQSGAREFVSNLLQTFRKEYPKRHSLIEELEEL